VEGQGREKVQLLKVMKVERGVNVEPVIAVLEVVFDVNGYEPVKVRLDAVLVWARFSLSVKVGVLIVSKGVDTKSLKLVRIPVSLFLYRWKYKLPLKL